MLGSYTYTAADLQQALEMLALGRLGPLDWVEERPLADGPAAFTELAGGRSGVPKTLLRP